uniref:Glycosyl hydrolase family 38 C-terminal domain-containing protein n=2 Tax=Corethron hystrix TaxID=216773 RepID=A0A7S1FLY3_9STRA|mmetsp:Transcript_12415/g.27292  ORF Transcript_12415/g.27292 Transcript_12415/m.27292 type:complete len:299 (+) Transcript_12415:2250-3146(+)
MAAKIGEGYSPCLVQDAPRAPPYNRCDSNDKKVMLFNPLNTLHMYCGIKVPASETIEATLKNCDEHVMQPKSSLQFDPKTGMVISPFKEKWMVWKVNKGGAYLFVPNQRPVVFDQKVEILHNGYKIKSSAWSRTIVEHENGAVDFIFETFLAHNNQEWFVRFETDIDNNGTFYTDLNGFNFDTHKYRSTLPIQAQVFPMPTLAAIQDNVKRFTVLSEHAQGTASLGNGMIDVFLDRRLRQDDNRGLGEGVMDNVRTKTRLRVVMETNIDFLGEFKPSPFCQQLWDKLNHPVEAFGENI